MLHPAIESNAEEVMTGVRWMYGLTRERTASKKSFPGADFAEKSSFCIGMQFVYKCSGKVMILPPIKGSTILKNL